MHHTAVFLRSQKRNISVQRLTLDVMLKMGLLVKRIVIYDKSTLHAHIIP